MNDDDLNLLEQFATEPSDLCGSYYDRVNAHRAAVARLLAAYRAATEREKRFRDLCQRAAARLGNPLLDTRLFQDIKDEIRLALAAASLDVSEAVRQDAEEDDNR
jgi:hypothetical protein